MNSNYVRGRAAEYAVKATLEAAGYECTRSASSQGLWDVVGVRADEVLLVQAKLTKSGDFSEDENCRLLRDLPVPANVRKELWLFQSGKGLIEVRNLKEPKHHLRTDEGKAQREDGRHRASALKRIVLSHKRGKTASSE